MKRECGDCSACCTLLSVTDKEANFFKPMGEDCKHLKDGKCSIYATKPRVCTEYYCIYLAGGETTHPGFKYAAKFVHDNERPSDCGVLISLNDPESEFAKETGIIAFTAYEVKPNAFSSYWGQKILKRIAKKTVVFLKHSKHDRLTAIGPKHLVLRTRDFEQNLMRKGRLTK